MRSTLSPLPILVGLCTAAASAVLLSSGCSLILDPTDTQCASNDDCERLGATGAACVEGTCRTEGLDAAPSGPWGCLTNASWPAPDPTQPIDLPLTFQKLAGRVPIEGLTIYTCRPFDLTCADPYGTATTDADGVAVMPIFKGFNGHIFVPEQAVYEGMMPLLVFTTPPPSSSSTESAGTAVLTKSNELAAVAGLAGVSVVPGYGHVTFTMFDCDSKRAAGVTLEVDPAADETATFYVSENEVPTTALDATSSKGEGGIINVPPGTVNVTASTQDHGVILQTTVLVVADGITGIGVDPGAL